MNTTLTRQYTTKQDLRNLNHELNMLVRNTYFDNIPIDELETICAGHGFEMSDISMLSGRSGRMSVPIGRGILLHFTWYRMDSGRWEIVAYAN
jgi:hypothetical protein